MKQGRSLQQLAEEIVRQGNAKKDYIAPIDKMEMVPTSGSEVSLALGEIPVLGATPIRQREVFGINPVAHGQIAEYAGIPKLYYDRCLKEAPALLSGQVNHWLTAKLVQTRGESRMIRTLDGRVRAVLSDRYRPLDNVDLAEAVLPVLQELDLFIASCEITERRLYIKAFDKRIEREIRVKGTDPAHTFLKDVVFPALTISNSEVGCGMLSVAAGLYTGGCTNFASFADSRMKKYHLGGKALDSSDVYALLSNETKAATDKAIWMQSRDVVKSAFEIARFEKLVERVQETADQKIEGDPVKVVEVTGQQFGFSKEERGSVLKHLIEGGTLSRYGLFNAITRTAEDLPEYERASEFERAGGELIELPRGSWEKLAKAA